MNGNEATDKGNERSHWHEKILNFQNASVYLQLLNARREDREKQDQDASSSVKPDEQAPDA